MGRVLIGLESSRLWQGYAIKARDGDTTIWLGLAAGSGRIWLGLAAGSGRRVVKEDAAGSGSCVGDGAYLQAWAVIEHVRNGLQDFVEVCRRSGCRWQLVRLVSAPKLVAVVVACTYPQESEGEGVRTCAVVAWRIRVDAGRT